MAGLAEGLACDDDAGMDSSDDEPDGLEEAKTGLDMLLRSLGPGVLAPRPPTAKPAPVERVNHDHPPVSSSPDSIRSDPAAPAAVSDTVVVESYNEVLCPAQLQAEAVDAELGKAIFQHRRRATCREQHIPSSIIGRGATDVQTQAFRKHAGTTKHKLAMEKQEALLNATSKQPRIDQHRAAVDAEKNRVMALLDSMLFVRLREALAAKDAAEELPVFDMVDDLIRAVADLLGRSGPRHARFMDLQEVITETSLKVQGIHSVWWLSWGDAVRRLVAVLPAVIVLLKELNSKMYALASSYRFHFFLYFLADVLEQLNILNKTFQQRQLDLVSLHAQIKRTTRHIESRYVDCGDDFGGGSSQWLSPFLERHGPGCSREVKVEGVDSDGRPSSFTFTLHDEPVDSYSGPEDHDGCIQLCTEFAERIMANLEGRLGDLDSLSGVRLFTPDAWPQSKSERNARCQEWLHSLVTMFKAQDREEILPGDNKKGKHDEPVDVDDEEPVGDAGGSSSDEDDEMSS
ncbi:unnamed protein product [Closterium sp. Naga37s-1]|nr:unnamed protein product [Closterium sp. Naga37s-1]